MHNPIGDPGKNDGGSGTDREYPDGRPWNWTARLPLAGALLALFAAVLGYEITHAGGLDQTALFYVGLPAVIALVVVLTVRPRSIIGTAMATVTVGLALAGPLLREGLVCLIMAAPLFYLVAFGIGWALDRRRSGLGALAVVPLLLAASLEGVGGIEYLPRADEGRAERIVAAAPLDVAAALAAEPDYAVPESSFLSTVPFPRPRSAAGTGISVGDRRVIEFDPRRTLGIGTRPTPRSMALEVTESRVDASGGRVVFTVVGDTTLARWLDLRSAEVAWTAAEDGTEVAWTLRYERTFDPSWYFGPLQKYAMDEAAGYLLDTFDGRTAAAPERGPGPSAWYSSRTS